MWHDLKSRFLSAGMTSYECIILFVVITATYWILMMYLPHPSWWRSGHYRWKYWTRANLNRCRWISVSRFGRSCCWRWLDFLFRIFFYHLFVWFMICFCQTCLFASPSNAGIGSCSHLSFHCTQYTWVHNIHLKRWFAIKSPS